jgi:hypothetical protein
VRGLYVAAVLALLGAGWMVWLLASQPTIDNPNQSTGPEYCLAVLDAPGLPSDDGKSGMDIETNQTVAARQDELLDACHRSRERRIGIAVLVAPVVAASASFVVFRLPRSRPRRA